MSTERERQRVRDELCEKAVWDQLRRKGRRFRWMVERTSELEEAMQTTCEVAIEKSDSFLGKSQLMTWLLSVLRNILLKRWRDVRRKSSRLASEFDLAAPSQDRPDRQVEVRECVERVRERLSDSDRQLFDLCWAGRESSEIMALLGIKRSAFDKRRARMIVDARNALRDLASSSSR